MAIATILAFAFTVQAGAEQDTPFDHFSTGFPLTGQHEQTRCESCHVGGTFAGTPRACGICHAPGSSIATTGKPTSHIPSGSDCDSCHTTESWARARFDHLTAAGSCASCHNGMMATGKSASHLATSADCATCHSTLAWRPATFDHLTVTGNCVSCHNGTLTATGKQRELIFRPRNVCEDCHSTASWSSGATFDHAERGGELRELPQRE